VRKIILRDRRQIPPFNEPARELSVLAKPLWLHHLDVLSPYTTEENEIDSLTEINNERVETLIYRDNLYFDKPFIDEFIGRARKLGKACQWPLSWTIPLLLVTPSTSNVAFVGRAITMWPISGITLTALNRWCVRW
jgi:hypothetical protein